MFLVKYFFLLVTVSMITRKVFFSSVHDNQGKKKSKFLFHSHVAYRFKKKENKKYHKSQKCISQVFANDPGHCEGVKVQQKILVRLEFYYHLSYIGMNVICLKCDFFKKNTLDSQLGHFLVRPP